MTSATVVICTHNRADLVGRSVDAAADQARRLGAEVLVVDNRSNDGTPAILRALEMRHQGTMRMVAEPRLGLSIARNRGLAEARGPVVVYLDDDAVPRPGWLAALLAPYTDPRVAAVGGRILLALTGTVPAWLTPELHSALSAYDLGSVPRAVRYGQATYPFGANISFRTNAARCAGGFSATVGPRGRHQLVHDETDLCYRMEHSGHEIRYAPDAVVDHWVVPERLSPDWMLRRHYHGGESAAVFILRNRGILRALWRVWWLYGDALATLPYTVHEPIDPRHFVRECRRREALGYVAGLLRTLPRLREIRRDMAA